MDYSVGFGHVIEAYWIGLMENLLKTHGFSDLLIVQFCHNVNYIFLPSRNSFSCSIRW